ncbi:hypothetical protein PHYBLDRAFT_167314 [Phycomyces blakesleeanus NRRL 1555(-)]|uniref:Uncharacterized protein n=1 Tax=Phycomyces blakesleeanus (strain ATCC 8743b / DSM 1359 / FGSC 10004 / NBRC 33097 / NRRL 1555) TaxID=763407 RepID=A0A167N4Q4_PHYB8|nr:hypothetical protein PHYBLDRAFT_167314 [Phycomyces blakesleeanus NRRL 1555(-)]OAD74989.1 hypothetical protein PHYBLDRAFT_167314 [Phycomyces blakesleeanus NRRL 1555(-)]|eukprot:XP_018293029.1 hypothetical protein PHYBLDRAFT_167314 [Phycomyces blakesleeanus NRRL 1555(-)]
MANVKDFLAVKPDHKVISRLDFYVNSSQSRLEDNKLKKKRIYCHLQYKYSSNQDFYFLFNKNEEVILVANRKGRLLVLKDMSFNYYQCSNIFGIIDSIEPLHIQFSRPFLAKKPGSSLRF